MASGGDGDGDGVSPHLYPGLVLSPLYMLPHLILTTGEKLKHGSGGSGEGWWVEDRQLALCTADQQQSRFQKAPCLYLTSRFAPRWPRLTLEGTRGGGPIA